MRRRDILSANDNKYHFQKEKIDVSGDNHLGLFVGLFVLFKVNLIFGCLKYILIDFYFNNFFFYRILFLSSFLLSCGVVSHIFFVIGDHKT